MRGSATSTSRPMCCLFPVMMRNRTLKPAHFIWVILRLVTRPCCGKLARPTNHCRTI
ncbi:UNVERIFIED_CONTAM: hypothetical protein GTU68_050373 [Idotea baltica]|nr:hypothetical protein [Idotea baltica]